jgi:hypothetical protein
MGALAIVLWIVALAGGAVFPPIFIAPIFATYLWWKRQRTAPKLARVFDPDELLKLVQLRDSGALSEDEFEAQKRRIMGAPARGKRKNTKAA